jgi:transcription initiation factor TFIIE subunit alpha
MELAITLVRRVARAFYDTEHVVVIEALSRHSALSIDDFRIVFANTGRGSKEIAKYLGRLRESGLVSVYGRQETKPNAQKATTVEYWYIDPRLAVDATNYKLHMIQETLTNQGKPTTEKKEYSCSRCKSEWTTMDVISHREPNGRGSGFTCPRCGNVLDYHSRGRGDKSDEDNVLSQFNKQLEPIIQLLKQIDQTTVPEVTGETALERAKPIPRLAEGGLRALPSITEAQKLRPTAVMGLKSGPEKVDVVLTTDSENTAAQQAAESERRARIAAQNQLPDWHTHSTVSGQAISEAKQDSDAAEPNGVKNENEAADEGKNVMSNAELDEYFRELEAARERDRQLEAEAEGESEEEDDDEDEMDSDEMDAIDEEFEDIPVELEPVKLKPPEPEKAEESATSTPVQISGDQADESDEDEEEFEDVV